MAGGFPAPPLEPEPPPWCAQFGRTAVAMPINVLELLADPAELAHAAGHTDRVEALRASLADHGPHSPLTVNADRHGRIVLADGHHRIIAALHAGIAILPIDVEAVDTIRGWSTSVAPVLGSLVRGDR